MPTFRIYLVILGLLLSLPIFSQDIDTFYYYKWSDQDNSIHAYIDLKSNYERDHADLFDAVVTSNTKFVYTSNGKYGIEDFYKNKLTNKLYATLINESRSKHYSDYFIANEKENFGYDQFNQCKLYSISHNGPISDRYFSEYFSSDEFIYLYDTLAHEYYFIDKKFNYPHLIDSLKKDQRGKTIFELIKDEKNFVLFTFHSEPTSKVNLDSLNNLFTDFILEKQLVDSQKIDQQMNLLPLSDTITDKEKKHKRMSLVLVELLEQKLASLSEYLRINKGSEAVIVSNEKRRKTDPLIDSKLTYSQNRSVYICKNSLDEYAVINEKGNFLIPFQNKKIHFIHKSEQGFILKFYAGVREYEILNERGVNISDQVYSTIFPKEYLGDTVLIVTKLDRTTDVINLKGESLLNAVYSSVSITNSSFMLCSNTSKKHTELFIGKKKVIDLLNGRMRVTSGPNKNSVQVSLTNGDLDVSFIIDQNEKYYLPQKLKRILQKKNIIL